MTMKYVLLDIDGVMVPIHSGQRPTLLEDGFMAFDPTCTAALRWLLDQAEIHIVLTTTHRVNHSREGWKVLFQHRGIDSRQLSKVNDASDLEEVGKRGQEIMEWVESKPIGANFVILDDDASLANLPDHIRSRWIRTGSFRGLTFQDAESALRLLAQANQDLGVG
jgi:hypothetical protein